MQPIADKALLDVDNLGAAVSKANQTHTSSLFVNLLKDWIQCQRCTVLILRAMLSSRLYCSIKRAYLPLQVIFRFEDKPRALYSLSQQ